MRLLVLAAADDAWIHRVSDGAGYRAGAYRETTPRALFFRLNIPGCAASRACSASAPASQSSKKDIPCRWRCGIQTVSGAETLALCLVSRTYLPLHTSCATLDTSCECARTLRARNGCGSRVAHSAARPPRIVIDARRVQMVCLDLWTPPDAVLNVSYDADTSRLVFTRNGVVDTVNAHHPLCNPYRTTQSSVLCLLHRAAPHAHIQYSTFSQHFLTVYSYIAPI